MGGKSLIRLGIAIATGVGAGFGDRQGIDAVGIAVDIVVAAVVAVVAAVEHYTQSAVPVSVLLPHLPQHPLVDLHLPTTS